MNVKSKNQEIIKQFNMAGYTGKNVVFALIDTGVTPVGYIKNKVIAGDIHGLEDYYGHGTFIASQLIQACPEATILSWNAGQERGSLAISMEKVIAALMDVKRYVKANPKYQYIVNLSLSGGLNETMKEELDKAIHELVESNVPVFCSAGNDGQEVLNKYPSCLQGPICVSALNEDGTKAPYSTWHNEVDFAEWGTNCTGLSPMGMSTTMSGTSMSCPNAAAKAGLICCAFAKSTGRWPTEPELYSALKACAVDLGEAGKDPYFGYGFLQPDSNDPFEQTEGDETMFEYVTDLGLVWPNGRTKRKFTDHIQIHHTVGDYSTPAKWKSLHQTRIEKDGYKGIEYSFGVCPDGTIYEGRGLAYCHGAVKNSLTRNEQNIGACDRSVSVTLIGDMRKDSLPTQAQWDAAVKLVKEIMAYYDLPATAVQGHNEIPTYADNKPTGKTYATLCPCIDMDQFRSALAPGTTGQPAPLPEPEPEPVEEDPSYPYMGSYTGSTYVNLRSGPGTEYTQIGKFSKGQNCIVLDEKNGWLEIITHEQTPILRGWCINTYTKAV